MIIDIVTGKTVTEMNPGPVRPRTEAFDRRHGRWHLVFADGAQTYAWGDDLIFFP